ncbi:DUF3231 family protein [Oceanobacillus saliphilus]|uniref:DUF3231 family protein n=1 Tax=Oceanobacillus saliphilus TaxID=2925834 RepID=UPI00201E06EC|nr:DUF3231 family protein [Oceanobacillus saliphilus]
MDKEHNIHLTAAELNNLWLNYMNDTMSICVFKHYLTNVEDPEIRAVIEYSLQVSENHIQRITSIFNEEQIVIPQGFTEADVNLQAPRLYNDMFYLTYVYNQAKLGLNAHTIALSNSAREDIRKFYSENISSSTELINRSSQIQQEKGIFLRAPFIPYPQKIEFVQQQSFLSGIAGNKRPLNAPEVSHIFFNLIRNITGATQLTGFSQVAQSKEVRDHMVRGKDIAKKHILIFNTLLSDNDLPAPHSWDTPRDSTIAPFSDKLMMAHVEAMQTAGIAYYGASLGASLRKDLGLDYSRLMIEVTQYAEDGANIMIKNGWMEKPPQAPDRQAIAKKQ